MTSNAQKRVLRIAKRHINAAIHSIADREVEDRANLPATESDDAAWGQVTHAIKILVDLEKRMLGRF